MKVRLNFIYSFVGFILLLLIWIALKYIFNISDRYLPSPTMVLSAYNEIHPSIFIHTAATCIRLLVGMIFGTILGIYIAIALFTSPMLKKILMPSIQSIRSIPPIATVPFFILWFGFEEVGKLLMIFLGVGLNILVASEQILKDMPTKYKVALKNFDQSAQQFPLKVCLPIIVCNILPTIRTTLSIIFGVVLVAELLGSQIGLGYLIQTSRTTYSMHVIFLVTIILGILNALIDKAIVIAWSKIVYWKSI